MKEHGEVFARSGGGELVQGVDLLHQFRQESKKVACVGVAAIIEMPAR